MSHVIRTASDAKPASNDQSENYNTLQQEMTARAPREDPNYAWLSMFESNRQRAHSTFWLKFNGVMSARHALKVLGYPTMEKKRILHCGIII